MNEVISILNYTKAIVPVVVHFVNFINYENMGNRTAPAGCFAADDLNSDDGEQRMTSYSDFMVSGVVNNNLDIFITLLEEINAALTPGSGQRRT